MKTKPTKTPKAVVAGLHFSAKGHPLFLSQCAIQGGDTYPWCLVLPCSSRKEANQRKKWANMSYEQKVEAIGNTLPQICVGKRQDWTPDVQSARAILALMGEPTP